MCVTVITVEPPSKGHFGTAAFVLCKEVDDVLFGTFEMFCSSYYREKIFWGLFCGETVLISERQLLKIPLYSTRGHDIH